MFLALTFEVLKFLFPAVIFYFTARMVVKAIIDHNEKKNLAPVVPDNSHILLPLQLQAYERFILLLERLTPSQAVNRVMAPGMTSHQLHLALIQSIREEFEHNTAQQIYISQEGWVRVKSAKEEITLLVNASASKTEASAPAGELAKNIFERWAEMEKNPIQIATDQLKNEVRKLIAG